MAEAPPPPLQILATPLCPGWRLKGGQILAECWYSHQKENIGKEYLYTRWFTILAPLAPRGWPRLTAPPWMFTLHQKVWFQKCRCYLAWSRLSSFMFAKTTTEKASLISHKSTSPGAIPTYSKLDKKKLSIWFDQSVQCVKIHNVFHFTTQIVEPGP